MDELALKAVVNGEIQDAAGYVSGDLSDQRSTAMDYYLGEPFGNEVEGRSQVVSTDVADTIEWIKPALLKTFTASDQAVRFDPEGPEDEQQAEQETDYVNHVFYKENEGFLVYYTWFNDALLQKNGIVKIFWDESEEVTRETYHNLTEDEFLLLLNDPELEPVEHSVSHIMPDGSVMEGEMEGLPSVHDVVFKRTRKKGQARVLNVPPEEFLISRDHNSIHLADAPFVCHRVDRTLSELLEMGYPKSKIYKIPTDSTSSQAETEEEIARDHLDEEQSPSNRSDKAMRKVKVYECYIRVDYDEDGIAELRKVTIAGNEILDNEEVDRIPFAAITPVILSHKFFGLSVADLVMDLQQVKSQLWRQMLDNLYLTNNPQREAVDGQVNLEDLMTMRPGGIVRVKQAGMVRDLTVPFVAGQSFQMMEYVDRIREQRTGVTENMQGQNQSLLTDTAHGIERLMTAAEARIELIARVFAETGVKDMFRQVHELLMKHQDKEKVVQIRNKWVPVNPSEWRTRNNLSVKVGLGTGDRAKLSQAMAAVLESQEKLMAGGGVGVLVSPKNIYNALSDFVKYNGIQDPEMYYTDPDSPEAQQAMAAQNQQQPNPLAEAENIKGQYALQVQQIKSQAQYEIDTLKAQMDADRKAMEAQQRAQIDILKAQIESAEKAADRRSKEAIAVMTQEVKALIEGYKTDMGKPGIGAGLQDG